MFTQLSWLYAPVTVLKALHIVKLNKIAKQLYVSMLQDRDKALFVLRCNLDTNVFGVSVSILVSSQSKVYDF